MITMRRKPQEEVMSRFARVQDAARQGAHAARQGAQAASEAAERFVPMANERVMIVRGWSAPRLRRAARYVEHGMAPRVSGFLSDVAGRVEPPPKRSVVSRNALMAMMGAVAAAGAAGVAATRRGGIRAMTKGTGEHVEGATSADSMTVSGADADGQVHSPH